MLSCTIFLGYDECMNKKSEQKKEKPSGLSVKMFKRVDDFGDEMRHEIHEMFIGKHTIFSLIGLTVGGSLMAKSLWTWLTQRIGLGGTLLVGFLLFVTSAFIMRAFDDHPMNPIKRFFDEKNTK